MVRVARLDPTTPLGLILATRDQIEAVGGKVGRKVRRPPRQRFPLTLERSYQREARSIAKVGESLIAELLIPRLGEIQRMAGIRDSRADIDTWAAVLASIFRDIRQRMAATDRRIEESASQAGQEVSSFNREQIRRQMRSVIGVDIFLNEPDLAAALESFTTDNVGLIKTIPERYFSEIEGIVSRAFRGGRRAADIVPEIRDRFRVSLGRANLIARDQISKLNGQLTRQRQTDLGLNQYIWRTSRDERVRESHRRLEGSVQSWDKPPLVGGSRRAHPGEDYQCRCTAEPVIPGVTPIKTSPKDVKRDPELVARARARRR